MMDNSEVLQLTNVELTCARVGVQGMTEVLQGVVRVRGMLMMCHCQVSSIPPPSSEHVAERVWLTHTT
jgi:hypothetical protein